MKKIIMIPARMDSKRLPGKPMLVAGGKPLVHWTYERAKRTEADYVIVATPDREIGRYCREHGLIFWPTRKDHPTGTHRCAEVLEELQRGPSEIGVVVNWQVDEPLVEPGAVNRLMGVFRGAEIRIATIVSRDELHGPDDSNTVKAAMSNDHAYWNRQVQWFSRAPMLGSVGHCGVYAFCPNMLLGLGGLEPTRLSKAESLEQLAWIEAGFKIGAIETERLPLSINTQADWEEFKRRSKDDN